MITLEVPDMACGGCANSIIKAVQIVDAKAVVNPDLESKTVTVESNLATSALLKVLEEAGYPAVAT